MQYKTIRQYFKSGKHKGVMVAVGNQDTKEVYFGFSLCNSKLDRYNKAHGLAIATNRAQKASVATVPQSMEVSYKRFVDRALRYFKGCTFYRQPLVSDNYTSDTKQMIMITKPFFDKDFMIA